ncbi:C3 and PZP alpha-2-macroglobulin domain-containing protein 8 [Daphnia magna]|uniref:C3 and PZP alpha-2-macroglobulin domain-containing protein n=2 Tax=Daphnia magna TaxID=35525 RepID=A0A0P4X2J3_9CRUS|nr:hypothetical protein OUZ56_004097 [Daphnia magna]KZS18550.1 C3 and PZP alpha-2-macroglobulin domain-containing protein 8 [Daphnia magna]
MTEIFTDDDKEYVIRPIKGKGQGRDTLTFDVKCKNDAHIALLSSEEITTPMVEIFIGGWANQKSAIRLNQSRPDKAEEPTPDIVCCEEYRRFWVRFRNNLIQVGREGDEEPFLSWENTEEPFKVTHFAFSTGWGSAGAWIFDDEEQSSSSSSSSSEEEDAEKIRQRGKKPFFRRPGVWLDMKDGKLPMRAVIGGVDSSGEKIYVGRLKKDGTLLPGKIVPSHNCCYAAHDGQECGSSKFQVLVRNKCCELIWVSAGDGHIPFGALQGGFSTDKEPVYVGRVMHEGATSIGLVHPSRGICLCSYGGEEICHNEYEVLVVKSIPL